MSFWEDFKKHYGAFKPIINADEQLFVHLCISFFKGIAFYLSFVPHVSSFLNLKKVKCHLSGMGGHVIKRPVQCHIKSK